MKSSSRGRMRRLAAALACAAILPFAAEAAPTVDFSDLWFNPAESGWGGNVIQQDDTLFVTLFVYGPNSQPTWYVASAATLVNGTTGTFTGPLYRTFGPYFGGPFVPGNVSVTQVGTITFTATSAGAATISYSVEGVNVTKSVVRQTWDTENVAGSYLGASTGNWTGCGNSRNGYQESAASYTISQDRSAIQVREEGQGYVCSYTGTYAQNGRLGSIQGGGTCSDGITQTFNASNVQMSPVGISMNAQFSQLNGCTFNGRIAAARKGS